MPIVVISLLGGLSQGVLCIYASGLDLEGLTPRLKRTQTTIITAAVAIVLLYIGVFVFDAVDSVTAMTVALNAVITPWVAILAIGALRTKAYDPVDLQAFAHGRRGGRYWFTGGWNMPAVVAWTVGAHVRPADREHHAVRRTAGRHRRRRGPEHHRVGRPGGVDLPGVAAVSSRHDTLSRRTGHRILQEVGDARPGGIGRLFHRRR